MFLQKVRPEGSEDGRQTSDKFPKYHARGTARVRLTGEPRSILFLLYCWLYLLSSQRLVLWTSFEARRVRDVDGGSEGRQH